MRLLTLSADRFSPDQLIRYGRFLRRRIRGRPDCADVLGTVDAALQALTTAKDGADDAAEERACLTAELEYLDSVLDAELASFVRFTLALLGSRSHPSFVKLFPVAPSEAMAEVGSAAQSAFVAAVLEAQVADPALAPLAGQAAQVQAALGALDACRARRSAAEVAENVAAGRLASAVAGLVTAYNDAFHTLSARFSGERGLVRSFFPKGPGGRKPRPESAEE